SSGGLSRRTRGSTSALISLATGDRDREVIPAIPSVEHAVVVLLVHAREKHDQAAPDMGFDQRDHLEDPHEPEKRAHAVNRDDSFFGRWGGVEDLIDPLSDKLLERGERGLSQPRRRLEVTQSVIRIRRTAKPIGKGVCQVNGLPAMSRLVGCLLEEADPEPQLPLVFLVVDGDPHPLRPCELLIPGKAAKSLVILAKLVDPAHPRPSTFFAGISGSVISTTPPAVL